MVEFDRSHNHFIQHTNITKHYIYVFLSGIIGIYAYLSIIYLYFVVVSGGESTYQCLQTGSEINRRRFEASHR